MFQKSFVAALFFSVVFTDGAYADLSTKDEAESCTPIRQGKVDVRIVSNRWVQEKGSYKMVSEFVCKGSAPLSVLRSIAAGCMTPVMLSCPIKLDGNQHKITVSGWIHHDHTGKKKIFSGGYHVNRNTTEVQTGEAANSAIQTSQLAMKEIGLTLQSKMDSPGGSIRDGIHVFIDFEDTHAE